MPVSEPATPSPQSPMLVPQAFRRSARAGDQPRPCARPDNDSRRGGVHAHPHSSAQLNSTDPGPLQQAGSSGFAGNSFMTGAGAEPRTAPYRSKADQSNKRDTARSDIGQAGDSPYGATVGDCLINWTAPSAGRADEVLDFTGNGRWKQGRRSEEGQLQALPPVLSGNVPSIPCHPAGSGRSSIHRHS
ncbi:MAG: hypothetical protein A4E69_01351 [Syntrophus sp. PtaB.Bin138]|nr:MAG: hypothetical protein A4E69_01351 [Syntrophus sp. PtaB.Bin138]